MAEHAQVPVPLGSPSFCHHAEVMEGFTRLFKIFQLPHPFLRQSLFASLLIENAIVLLSGTYGTGKTQLVQLIRKVCFSDQGEETPFALETCHQDLTAFDVLYHLDLAELQAGREVVHPKPMVVARLKFLNEIQRASPGLFNALLPLLAERRVVYREQEFQAPSFVCIMDRNPFDAGSSEIPEAFLDRIDYSFEIPAAHLQESLCIQKLRRTPGGYHWGAIDDLADPILSIGRLERVWADVRLVEIPRRTSLLAGMLTDSFRLCISTERSIARPEYDLACHDCQFQGEVCSHLLKVPGMRLDNSLLRLAQALAWMDKRRHAGDQDILKALPWCLPHRLALRPEELRKQPSEQAWIQEVALAEILRPKLPFWERAIHALASGNEGQLIQLAENDLIVRELLLLLRKEKRLGRRRKTG